MLTGNWVLCIFSKTFRELRIAYYNFTWIFSCVRHYIWSSLFCVHHLVRINEQVRSDKYPLGWVEKQYWDIIIWQSALRAELHVTFMLDQTKNIFGLMEELGLKTEIKMAQSVTAAKAMRLSSIKRKLTCRVRYRDSAPVYSSLASFKNQKTKGNGPHHFHLQDPGRYQIQ